MAIEVSRRNLLRAGGAAIVAGLGPLGLGVSACSRAPDTESSGDGGRFTLYTNANHAYETWVDVVKQFESDHGLTVNWQKFQWDDLQTKLQADLAAGTVPDLVEQSTGSAAVTLAIADDLLALDDHIAADGKTMGYPDDWQPQAAESWTYNGKTYGVQVALTCNQLYYNKQMLADAGIAKPPATWAEFLAAAKELTRGNVYGCALNQDYSYSWCWLLQNGVRYYDAGAKAFLQPTDAAIEAMQFQADLVHKYKVSPVPTSSSDPTGPQKLFTAKRAAMIFTGPWDVKAIRTAAPDIDLGVALPLQGKNRSTYFAGAGFAIPRKSAKADLAWDLIKRITTLEAQLKLTKEAGQTMPRKSWADSAEVKADPVASQVALALPYTADWTRALVPTGKLTEANAAYKSFYQAVVLSNRPAAAELDTFLAAAKRAVG